LKDYDRQFFWLEYFDSGLSREEGRRVSLSLATKNPTLDELASAARRLGYEPAVQKARRPSRTMKESGYIQIAKKGPKNGVLVQLARALADVRSQQKR
jgi:signal recognition particle subunit SRP19